VCGEMHLFKECLYIVTAARKNFLEWKENVKTLNEARQRILKNVRFQTIIKVIIDINTERIEQWNGSKRKYWDSWIERDDFIQIW
jgi:hypothetical protein